MNPAPHDIFTLFPHSPPPPSSFLSASSYTHLKREGGIVFLACMLQTRIQKNVCPESVFPKNIVQLPAHGIHWLYCPLGFYPFPNKNSLWLWLWRPLLAFNTSKAKGGGGKEIRVMITTPSRSVPARRIEQTHTQIERRGWRGRVARRKKLREKILK